MDMGIKGRNAIVTGASRGIGLAIAQGLAAEGVNVALVARNSAVLDKECAAIASTYGVQAAAIPADLKSLDAVQSSAVKATEKLGPIDILVNSAGAIPASSLSSLEDETFHDAWSLKLSGYIRMTREIISGMRERGWGRIVNIVGLGGKNPSAGHLYGGVANAALMNFTGALALDVAKDGILVNAINPGMIESERIIEMGQKWADDAGISVEDLLAKQTAGLPMRRMGSLQEVSDVAVFLSSERCTYVHGTIIPVAGGMGTTI
ncbi:MAG: SDR family oxidoreductase [Pseudomonadales bacterium]|nr:SDR family oxidoreductase [Pseudomonadales bacterium]